MIINSYVKKNFLTFSILVPTFSILVPSFSILVPSFSFFFPGFSEVKGLLKGEAMGIFRAFGRGFCGWEGAKRKDRRRGGDRNSYPWGLKLVTRGRNKMGQYFGLQLCACFKRQYFSKIILMGQAVCCFHQAILSIIYNKIFYLTVNFRQLQFAVMSTI